MCIVSNLNRATDRNTYFKWVFMFHQRDEFARYFFSKHCCIAWAKVNTTMCAQLNQSIYHVHLGSYVHPSQIPLFRPSNANKACLRSHHHWLGGLQLELWITQYAYFQFFFCSMKCTKKYMGAYQDYMQNLGPIWHGLTSLVKLLFFLLRFHK